ncbi:MAG: hypothetical protein QM755_21365 [Luteolibacter sp.]
MLDVEDADGAEVGLAGGDVAVLEVTELEAERIACAASWSKNAAVKA